MDEWQQRVYDLGELTKELARDVPKALEAGLSEEQANRMYIVLVRHAEAVDELLDDLDEADANPHLIEAAEHLADISSQLVIAVAGHLNAKLRR